jgi:hypothetical protein
VLPARHGWHCDTLLAKAIGLPLHPKDQPYSVRQIVARFWYDDGAWE